MPIIYSLVARGTTVLTDFTAASGNFPTVTRRILEKIPPQDGKLSYAYDNYLFHYMVSNGMTYLCMADEGFPRRLVFSFLEDIQTRFMGTFGDRAKTAHAYAMNEDFHKVLSARMEYFSSNPESDKISKAMGEVGEVKSIMVQNIEKVLDRGEKLDILVDKTDHLNRQANSFKHNSTKLRKAMWWKNMKLNLIILFVVLVLILFLVMAVCGTDFQCDKK